MVCCALGIERPDGSIAVLQFFDQDLAALDFDPVRLLAERVLVGVPAALLWRH